MEKEKNIIKANYHLKENTFMGIKEKEKNMMLMEKWFMKENIYMTRNGMEKYLMKMIKYYML